MINSLRAQGDSSTSSDRTLPVPFAARSSRTSAGRHEVALDAVLLCLAALAASLSARAASAPGSSLEWDIPFILVTLVALGLAGAYRSRFVSHFLDDSRRMLGSTAMAAMTITFARVLFTNDPEIAAQEARLWLFAATYLVAGHGGFELVRSRARRAGRDAEPVLIVGAGRIGRLIATRLSERKEFGLRPVAFFDNDPLDAAMASDLPIFGSGTPTRQTDGEAFADGIEHAIRAMSVRHVIVTFSLASHELELALLRRCQEMGITVSLVPRLFEGVPDQTTLERIGGIPLISVHPRNPRGWQFAVKYACDRILALIAIIVLSPFLLLAAIGTLLTLGRPVLFRQPRIGIDGHAFEMLKFRTMRPGPPGESNILADELERGLAPGGVEGADRRTRLGIFLRASSIDELPQLFNVLRGDMSLIGPRPERPEFVERFAAQIHRYPDRLRVKSGVTGWAQVHGLRGRTSLADRVEWDNYYIENWSLWLDLKIVVLTLVAIVRDRSE